LLVHLQIVDVETTAITLAEELGMSDRMWAVVKKMQAGTVNRNKLNTEWVGNSLLVDSEQVERDPGTDLRSWVQRVTHGLTSC
jgi:hypothetical protein